MAPANPARWLHEGMKDTVLNSADAVLDRYPVSREVNNVRSENPDLILPVRVERKFSRQE